jgi:hypothetical protein
LECESLVAGETDGVELPLFSVFSLLADIRFLLWRAKRQNIIGELVANSHMAAVAIQKDGTYAPRRNPAIGMANLWIRRCTALAARAPSAWRSGRFGAPGRGRVFIGLASPES